MTDGLPSAGIPRHMRHECRPVTTPQQPPFTVHWNGPGVAHWQEGL